MHSLKDIAFQAGVSLATVDRVIHERPGVKANTRRRVQAAIRELDRQAASNASDGRRIAVDIILEAPRRFSTAVRAAFEAERAELPEIVGGKGHLVDGSVAQLGE